LPAKGKVTHGEFGTLTETDKIARQPFDILSEKRGQVADGR
jgi:hypothetical protein